MRGAAENENLQMLHIACKLVYHQSDITNIIPDIKLNRFCKNDLWIFHIIK